MITTSSNMVALKKDVAQDRYCNGTLVCGISIVMSSRRIGFEDVENNAMSPSIWYSLVDFKYETQQHETW